MEPATEQNPRSPRTITYHLWFWIRRAAHFTVVLQKLGIAYHCCKIISRVFASPRQMDSMRPRRIPNTNQVLLSQAPATASILRSHAHAYRTQHIHSTLFLLCYMVVQLWVCVCVQYAEHCHLCAPGTLAHPLRPCRIAFRPTCPVPPSVSNQYIVWGINLYL